MSRNILKISGFLFNIFKKITTDLSKFEKYL